MKRKDIPPFCEHDEKIYSPDQVQELIQEALSEDCLVRKRGGKDRPRYYNIPAAFDIETTSANMADGEKVSAMYIWQLGINGRCMIGRTWDEWESVINEISERLQLSSDKRLLIYVHNLAYEFQFFRKHVEIDQVFAIDQRRPVKVLLKCGIEFRCSYILTNYSLETVGKNLLKYKVEKKTGDLDYSLYRHSGTPLTEEEIGYCINDIRVVMAYIQERIETDGNITKIQLTKTGYVRKLCRDACFEHFQDYRDLMRNLTLTAEEYSLCKRAFQGGFTHASALNSGKIFQDVGSFDFTSSYPAVMVAERYPMNKGIKVKPKTMQEFEKYLQLYCCIFDVEFTGLQAKTLLEHPLSRSRCTTAAGAVTDNGRIFSADLVRTTCTEVDYKIYQSFYTWDTVSVGLMYVYYRDYLPTPFIKSILSLYQKKTELKNVKGSEAEYMAAKENVNSAYGMLVTDIVKDDQVYSGDEWSVDPADTEESIDRYNQSKNRFSFYPWGVYVTAYARRNLFTGISACIRSGANYIYSDTDSLKVQRPDLISDYIENYNEAIIRKLEAACRYHGIDPAAIRPKTVKGVEKPLGVWDYEGIYKRFKALGAKRYMTEDEEGLSITVSGVNKHSAIPWLMEKYGSIEKCFEAFRDDLIFPEEATGKNTHTYLDDPMDFMLTDYLGNRQECHELSGVHLSGAEYHLSLSKEYVDFLKGVISEERKNL